MDYPVDRQYFINQNREVRFFKWNSFPTGDRWLELVEAIEKFQMSLLMSLFKKQGQIPHYRIITDNVRYPYLLVTIFFELAVSTAKV